MNAGPSQEHTGKQVFRGQSDSDQGNLTFVVFLTFLFFFSQADVREDEEQNVKLQETIELLLAAGYFRARIKGLSPFDKVW